MIPRISNYGNATSSNYGFNTLLFTDNKGREFFFSYTTLVAARIGDTLIVRENAWGNTTGKHLNLIDGGDKANRLTKQEFEMVLARVLDGDPVPLEVA